ncbi:phage head-tail connector protein [Paenibacillus woosongensis]|uniref:Phage gp6-like head-tail connector protein n=1 Tax=Paenibacillus woosongensis TaxID=307580 RepID=A0ABQ4MPM7_9BACL|nr:phage head-tail connector protein [Paenibacillus woosongensis]GIP57908.1 hypothetical protein J15TS10_17220 [Paenibacillus woosongensis]
MLDKFKLQLGIKLDDDSEDDLLGLLLEDAIEDVLTWTNRTELPVSLESVVRQVAVIRYNKQGAEGQSSHSEGGISRSFEDLPKGLQDSLLQKRLVKLVTYQ